MPTTPRRFEAIRAVEQELGRPIAVVADLQGPKLRLGTFADGAITVSVGHKIRLDMDPTPGTAERVSMPHPEIFTGLKAGNTLLVDDGKVRLLVESCGADFANCVVEAGTRLSDRKGVNVPDAIIPLDALTP
jgi:pyruvate kinase